MGTAAGFDTTDALRRQGTGLGEELGILLGVDVIGDDRQLQAITQAQAEGLHQGRLAGTHRTGHPHP